MTRQPTRDPLVPLARALGACARAVPRAWSDAAGRLLGWGWYRLVPVRRAVARRQVAEALAVGWPEAERVVRGMYRHLGRSFVELFLMAGRPARLDAAGIPVEVEGRAHLDAALAEGRGVIVLSGHLGNFELLVRLGGALDAPAWVVTNAFRSRVAERLWRALRSGGPGLLPASGSGRAVLRALDRGEIVAFVLDQNVPPRGAVFVPFFGRLAATSPGLAKVALRSGAPIVPIFASRTAAGHRLVVEPPIRPVATGDRDADVRMLTARCAAVVEAAIRGRPEQWLWIHRRWKTRPEGGGT